MSEESLEIIRRAAEAWNRFGWRGLAEVGLLDPGIEYHDDRKWPEARSTVGVDALIARFDEVLEVLGEEGTLQVEEIRDAGEDRVVMVFRFRGEARASGIRHDHRWGYLARVRDGRIIYLQAYLEPEDAFEAAGLSE